MIVGQIGGQPWEGKNSRFVQGLTTGPHHLQVAGGNLLPVPRPIAAPMYPRAGLDVVETPPRAGRCPDEPARVGPDAAWSCPARIGPQPRAGLGVAQVKGHRPPHAGTAAPAVRG